VPRVDVDAWYRKAQVFLFPSFREPSGNVVFEAMGFALPMIVADAGGPGFTVDDDCGVKIAITDPERFARDISRAVEVLAGDVALREQRGRAALERVAEVGAWDRRIERLEEAYSLVKLGGGS
jgi:glycosyltransferase involved in cell wall biosynthesis